MSEARVIAVVVAFDGGRLLEQAVDALVTSEIDDLRVVVADNASRDGVPRELAARHRAVVRVLELGSNLGFAGAVNAAIEWVAGDAEHDRTVYALVNQDCIVRPDTISALVTPLVRDPGIGVVGGRLLEADGTTVQHAGGGVRENGLTYHIGRGSTGPDAFTTAADVEYVTGALFALRADTWRWLGPLDAGYFPAYFEEVDLCRRIRARGLRVVYEPSAEAVHHEATSTGRGGRRFLQLYHRNRIRFVARHLLRRGRIARTLGAEGRWLVAQREPAQVLPALRAYLGLPRDLLDARHDRARGGLP